MDGGAGVVALRHQRHVAVLHRHRLVERTVVRIDALEGKTLRRVEAVVVGLLQEALVRKVVLVVLVRGVGRGVAARRDHLDDEQRMGRIVVFRHDVVDMPDIRALAAADLRMRARRNGLGLVVAAARGRADGKFQVRLRRDRPVGIGRDVKRVRRAVEGAHALAENAEILARRRRLALAGDPHEADLAASRLGRQDLARLHAVQVEADIGPAGAFGRHMADAAMVAFGFDDEGRHGLLPFGRHRGRVILSETLPSPRYSPPPS